MTTNLFWDSRWFLGPATPGQTARPPFVVQSYFSGCMVVSSLPRHEMEALLPPELELAENASPAAGVHPVVFTLGTHTRCTALFRETNVGTAADYDEFMVAIPFVRQRGRRWLHTYIPRMYSSAALTIWNGNVYYGFGKRVAHMNRRGSLLLLTSQDGELLCHANVEARNAHPGSSRNFTHLQEVFQLPVLGRRHKQTYTSAYFGWNVPPQGVCAARGYIELDAPMIAGLGPRAFEGAEDGTFQIREMVWRLSWPLPMRP